MDKHHVVYLYNGTLLGHKKDWTIDVGYNMGEPWKHCAKWKKAVTDHILYDYIYVKFPE